MLAFFIHCMDTLLGFGAFQPEESCLGFRSEEIRSRESAHLSSARPDSRPCCHPTGYRNHMMINDAMMSHGFSWTLQALACSERIQSDSLMSLGASASRHTPPINVLVNTADYARWRRTCRLGRCKKCAPLLSRSCRAGSPEGTPDPPQRIPGTKQVKGKPDLPCPEI